MLDALSIGLRRSSSGEDGSRLSIRARPGARRSGIRGVRESSLLVDLAAPPVDGAANEELVRFLAEVLGVPKGRITLVRGASGRDKLVDIDGLPPEELRARLDAHT